MWFGISYQVGGKSHPSRVNQPKNTLNSTKPKMEFHDLINSALTEYEGIDEDLDTHNTGSVINSKKTLNKLTYIIRDINVFDYNGKRSYRLSTLISMITRVFGFNGFNIEINEIQFNNETLRYKTTVDIIIRSDESVIQGVSKNQKNLKKSITHAIKNALIHEVERVYFRTHDSSINI